MGRTVALLSFDVGGIFAFSARVGGGVDSLVLAGWEWRTFEIGFAVGAGLGLDQWNGTEAVITKLVEAGRRGGEVEMDIVRCDAHTHTHTH